MAKKKNNFLSGDSFKKESRYIINKGKNMKNIKLTIEYDGKDFNRLAETKR